MKKTSILFLILIVFLLTIFLLSNDLKNTYSQFSLKLPQEITEFISKEAEKIIFTPPPIRSDSENSQSSLTQAGVIKWTNERRLEQGLTPLIENPELNKMAQAKVDDMFLKQYFAHVSPQGEGVENLAEDFKYEFIVIGENLALGNYKNDENLVQAWMASIGHRENILNTRYQEIGVAVKKGVFAATDDLSGASLAPSEREGRTTWLAVQHFGLPLDACPSPDKKLKLQIDINQEKIENLQKTLTDLQNEIISMKPKRGSLYVQKIEEYNNLVAEYNNLVNETKILINKYNSGINLFNECVTAAS